MFLFKKIIGILLAPGTIILVVFASALWYLSRADRDRRTGARWLLFGMVCFYLFTTAPLSIVLLRPLERRSPALTELARLPAPRYIVVLAGGPGRVNNVPPTSFLEEATALRVIEGVRIFYQLSGQAILIMSGGGELQSGARMAAFAAALGVPANKLLAETNSLDTHGNAREVQPLVQSAPFVLVTSASHLPRALKIFQGLGMQPIPAPADFRSPDSLQLSDFLPAGVHLKNLETALHEYWGLLYLYFFPDRLGR